MMNKIGIYPGTFDPMTAGHMDIIKRSLRIVDNLVIAVANNINKDSLFSCLLYTSPSPRDRIASRMPSSA